MLFGHNLKAQHAGVKGLGGLRVGDKQLDVPRADHGRSVAGGEGRCKPPVARLGRAWYNY